MKHLTRRLFRIGEIPKEYECRVIGISKHLVVSVQARDYEAITLFEPLSALNWCLVADSCHEEDTVSDDVCPHESSKHSRATSNVVHPHNHLDLSKQQKTSRFSHKQAQAIRVKLSIPIHCSRPHLSPPSQLDPISNSPYNNKSPVA